MRINPLVVLLFNIILPLAVMFPGNKYQHIFFLGFAIVTLLISAKFKRLAKFVTIYLVLLGMQHFFISSNAISSKTFGMILMISIQFIPCLMMASILVKDYSPSELISALEPFKIPKPFLVSLAIVVRYMPTFKREFLFMKESMRLRGIPYSIRKPIKSFEYFLVPQLFRCSILADEITSAALTKGITNPKRRTSYYDMRMKAIDSFMCILLIAGTGGFIIWR